ncbi:FtsK/SpoIIIE domain-containing protein [Paenibacillus mesotrionivorans]|uniref:FtsK/SpoIIIE domain-containing protein n=1 Tax=Paenibacillus mesotrionivorans TaxID=3160968 RepID=A0ACC7NWH8_9BACL
MQEPDEGQNPKPKKHPFEEIFELSMFFLLPGALLYSLDTLEHVTGLLFKIGGGLLGVGVIREIWRHRSHVLHLFNRRKELVHSHAEQASPLSNPPVTVPDMSGTWRTAPADKEDNPYRQRGIQLSEPHSLLPVNPKPRPSDTMSGDVAADLMSGAMQMCGMNVDQPLDILSIDSGPTLQSISFRLPAKVQLTALKKREEDLANHLGSHLGFEVSTAPYKSSASFVIPHTDRAFVYLRDVMSDPRYQEFANKAELPFVLGKDMRGNPLFADFTKMPHMLVAGATNSGKSVFVNGVLGSLLLGCGPERLKLLLIDPKAVELAIYKGFPHLLAPPITDMRRAALAFNKVILEMEKRYEQMAELGVRNILEYNQKASEKLPYILVVVDEHADMMMVAGAEVEDAIQRISQKARAAGIHLILATQRPSVDVVTGIIKANMPCRVSFRLQSSVDYRTVLDRGAPNLMGFGDGMILYPNGSTSRFQSASVSVVDSEATDFITGLKSYWVEKNQGTLEEWDMQNLEERQMELEDIIGPFDNSSKDNAEVAEGEPDLLTSALQVINEAGQASVSLLQRRLRIGYSQAAKLVEDMERMGHVGPYEGGKPREVLKSTAAKGFELDKNYSLAKQILKSRGNISEEILKYELKLPYEAANQLLRKLDEEGLLEHPVSGSNVRSLKDENRTDEELLEQMKYFICTTNNTRSSDLQRILGVRKERVLSLMQSLVSEGFLAPPLSSRAGYTLLWEEGQIQNYLESKAEMD